MNIKSLMKKACVGTLIAIGIFFSISPAHSWKGGGLEGQYACKDMVAVSKLVAGGTTWTSSQTSYAHAVLAEVDQVLAGFLKHYLKKANEGNQEAKNMMSMLARKGMGENMSRRNELTLKVMQRVHLAEARVKSLGLDLPNCVAYGLGAYAAS